MSLSRKLRFRLEEMFYGKREHFIRILIQNGSTRQQAERFYLRLKVAAAESILEDYDRANA